MPQTFLTMAEFIERTRLSRSAAYALVKRGRLGVWFDGALRIPESVLTKIAQDGGVWTLPKASERATETVGAPKDAA
jgi:hypothetical protein